MVWKIKGYGGRKASRQSEVKGVAFNDVYESWVARFRHWTLRYKNGVKKEICTYFPWRRYLWEDDDYDNADEDQQ